MASVYPVRVDARLEPKLSRWLWLVKWLLVIPHMIALAVLWAAFVVLSVVAFVAIVFTGRYPRGIFEFNLGVLRWSWRVGYYSYSALGTDRYPPFSLAEEPDYPATLHVEYPARLSRGLVWVKWWLLALPHYIVVAFFVGGGWLAWESADSRLRTSLGGGLVGVLVVAAALVLLFTSRYPRGIFDLVLGMNRWALRVAAYAGLMTDDYPPFRLDLGGSDPGTTALLVPERPGGAPGEVAEPGRRPAGWTGGRIVSVVAGALLIVVAAGPLAAGSVGAWADRTQRDSAGYLRTSEQTFTTSGTALVVNQVEIWSDGPRWFFPDRVLGDVQVQVTPAGAASAVFVGLGPSADVTSYLAGSSYDVVDRVGVGTSPTYTPHAGGAAVAAPANQDFWTVQTSGTGTQTLTWTPETGRWALAVLSPDGSAGLTVRASIAATAPALGWLSGGLLFVGVLLLAAGAALVGVAALRASGRSTIEAPTEPPVPGAAS